MKFAIAKAVSAASTWGLKNVFRRPAGNFPGKMALYADPQLIEHLRPRLTEGSIVVVGTNGKTSTTNLLADALEANGKSVMCNRGGANLDSGVATTMLQSPTVQWGVFETDELWLAKVLPQLQATYVLLLNLFRDQLDRMGEVDRIQESIVGALAKSPETVLIYNADDPLCQAIADAAPNHAVAFGMGERLSEEAGEGVIAQMCQKCGSVLHYAYRQYDQLGEYVCSQCGFARSMPSFVGKNMRMGVDGMTLEAVDARNSENGECVESRGTSSYEIFSRQNSVYVAYNLLATYAAATLAGCSTEALQKAIDAFNPQNGRLQRYRIGGHDILLNLAKNPTGFNQNLQIADSCEGPKAIAFFVNDKEGDGRDVSWLWDVHFEKITAWQNSVAYAGGIRKNDVQVRLKYAGVSAPLVETVADVLNDPHLPDAANVYLIANYTALPAVKAELDALVGAVSQADVAVGTVSQEGVVAGIESQAGATSQVNAMPQASALVDEVAPPSDPTASEPEVEETSDDPVVIAQLYPELLNLQGDGGNAVVLGQRLAWRGIPVEVRHVHVGDDLALAEADLALLGAGFEREQRLAARLLLQEKEPLQEFVCSDGVLFATGCGFQMLGRTWLSGDEELGGLGLVDMVTTRQASYSMAPVSRSSASRVPNDIVLNLELESLPVVGYEHSAGCATEGEGISDTRGVILGTSLHGPVLAKNPEVADGLLRKALERWAIRTGHEAPELLGLPDEEERAANEYAIKRFM